MKIMAIIAALLFTTQGEAEGKKKVSYRKTQEVSFDAADIDGVVRSPDGAYLLQKQSVKFMPLYKVNRQFEKNIKASVEYLR
ncbi:MAG: hypothetical protein AB7N80_13400 [Bdellovibrionales bacterium]